MKINKIPPNLTVFAPNQKDVYGIITVPLHLKIEYNFGTYSTMEFEVYEKIYDECTEQWIDNPVYDSLVEDNLIYAPKENDVFSYNVNRLLNDNEYGIDTDANQTNKQSNVKSGVEVLEYVPKMKGCVLCNETQLFDIGANSGYGWSYKKELYANTSNPSASGYVVEGNFMSNIAQEIFFPAKVGDIIAMGSEVDKTNNSDLYCSVASGLGAERYRYRMFFYQGSSSNRCIHIGDTQSSETNSDASISYSPAKRYVIRDGDFGKIHIHSGENHYYEYQKEGFIRLDCFAPNGASSPAAGYVRIFDGERRCKKVNVGDKETVKHNIPWWVIVNTEIVDDNRNKKKIIKAYSYEYTLSKRNVTIEDDTLPLYIPDNIVDVVNSNNFVIDKWDGTVTKGSQRMKRGLINQVLDNLSGWKVKYISDGIMERYRQIEDVDNTNIYTFLISTVQSKYQCHIIFDCENKYINIVKHEDIISAPNTNVILDWRNCLKQFSINNNDNKYVTALRIHSEDDTYGLGLVNPNGSNIIYNFNNIIDRLDYSVDSTHINPNTNAPYTLKELINVYNSGIANDLTTYRGYAKTLIQLTKEKYKHEVGLSEALTQYLKVVAENNVLVKINGGTAQVPEVPPSNGDFGSNGLWSYIDNSTNNPRPCWASHDKYEEIKSTTEDYWKARITYSDRIISITGIKYRLKTIANKYSFILNTLKKYYNEATFTDGQLDSNSYPCVFTPVEMVELYKYIYEGDWTHQNIVFNDEYSVDDIYDTLVDLYDTGRYELDHIYYKPNYDFETEIVDMYRNPEMAVVCEDLYLGNSLYLSESNGYLEPLLLTFRIEYDNYNSSKATFTTDYKRKPIDFRVYELLATVNQQSVTSPTYTFDN